MADTFEVSWLPEALRLLRKRDHYTRQAIEDDFKVNPKKEAVEFDPEKHSYATPVADKRFIVVWDMEERTGKKTAKVRAVIPTQLISTEPADVKNQLKELVEMESRGSVKIE